MSLMKYQVPESKNEDENSILNLLNEKKAAFLRSCVEFLLMGRSLGRSVGRLVKVV